MCVRFFVASAICFKSCKWSTWKKPRSISLHFHVAFKSQLFPRGYVANIDRITPDGEVAFSSWHNRKFGCNSTNLTQPRRPLTTEVKPNMRKVATIVARNVAHCFSHYIHTVQAVKRGQTGDSIGCMLFSIPRNVK